MKGKKSLGHMAMMPARPPKRPKKAAPMKPQRMTKAAPRRAAKRGR